LLTYWHWTGRDVSSLPTALPGETSLRHERHHDRDRDSPTLRVPEHCPYAPGTDIPLTFFPELEAEEEDLELVEGAAERTIPSSSSSSTSTSLTSTAVLGVPVVARVEKAFLPFTMSQALLVTVVLDTTTATVESGIAIKAATSTDGSADDCDSMLLSPNQGQGPDSEDDDARRRMRRRRRLPPLLPRTGRALLKLYDHRWTRRDSYDSPWSFEAERKARARWSRRRRSVKTTGGGTPTRDDDYCLRDSELDPSVVEYVEERYRRFCERSFETEREAYKRLRGGGFQGDGIPRCYGWVRVKGEFIEETIGRGVRRRASAETNDNDDGGKGEEEGQEDDDGVPVVYGLLLEYIEGSVTLARRGRRQEPAVALSRVLRRKLLATVAGIIKAGIIHNDIRLDNILVTSEPPPSSSYNKHSQPPPPGQQQQQQGRRIVLIDFACSVLRPLHHPEIGARLESMSWPAIRDWLDRDDHQDNNRCVCGCFEKEEKDWRTWMRYRYYSPEMDAVRSILATRPWGDDDAQWEPSPLILDDIDADDDGDASAVRYYNETIDCMSEASRRRWYVKAHYSDDDRDREHHHHLHAATAAAELPKWIPKENVLAWARRRRPHDGDPQGQIQDPDVYLRPRPGSPDYVPSEDEDDGGRVLND
jgi:hypothetical protein